MRSFISLYAFWLILKTQRFITASSVKVEIINQDIPSPLSPVFSSINVNHVLTWEYLPLENTRDVHFDIQVNEIFYEDDWVSECPKTINLHCDIVQSIHMYDSGCPEFGYAGEYRARVRACVSNSNGSVECSGWSYTTKNLNLPYDDHLSPPNFEIEGIFNTTQLSVKNYPIIVKHLNKSLNCYHDNKLSYEIKYWGTNDSSQKLQETQISFEASNMALRLFQEPLTETEICVQMRIVHTVKLYSSDWSTECSIYNREIFYGLSKIALTAIITGSVSCSLAIVILLIIKATRFYKSVYHEKFEIPNDLADLMRDSLSNIHMSASQRCINETAEDIIVEKDREGNYIKKHLFRYASEEVVHLISPAVMKSSFSTENEEKKCSIDTEQSEENYSVSKVEAGVLDSDRNSTLDNSDNESIPYVYSTDSTDPRMDVEHMSAKTDSSSSVSSRRNVLQRVTQNKDNNKVKFMQEKDFVDRQYGYGQLTHNFPRCQRFRSDPNLLASDLAASTTFEITNELSRGSRGDVTFRQILQTSNARLVAKESDCYTTMSEVFLSCDSSRTRSILQSTSPLNPLETTESIGSNKGRIEENISLSNADLIVTRDHVEQDEVSLPPRKILFIGSLSNPTYNSEPATFDVCDDLHHCSENDHSTFEAEEGEPIPPSHEENLQSYEPESIRPCYEFSKKTTKSLYQRRRMGSRYMKARVLSPSRPKDLVLDISDDGPSFVKSRNQYSGSLRRHSCSSGTSTISPVRDRIVSVDSGYHMGSYSLSDECCSLSPPISPMDNLYPDVFGGDDSPKSNRVENLLLSTGYQLPDYVRSTHRSRKRNDVVNASPMKLNVPVDSMCPSLATLIESSDDKSEFAPYVQNALIRRCTYHSSAVTSDSESMQSEIIAPDFSSNISEEMDDQYMLYVRVQDNDVIHC